MGSYEVQIFIFLTTFYFNSLHFRTNIWTFYSFHSIQNFTLILMHLREMINYFLFLGHCMPPSLTWHYRFQPHQSTSYIVDVARRSDVTRQKGVLVFFYLHKPCSALPACSYFFYLLLCSGHLTIPKCWYLMSREWVSTNSHLSGTLKDSSDKCYWFYIEF